jgi:hypothetical protein
VRTIRWYPVQTRWITLTLSINAINNHNDNIYFQYFVETRSFLLPMSEIQCWQTSYCKSPLLGDIYAVVRTIRWYPVQTRWITLTLSINAINNRNDNIDYQYSVKTRSCLPPMSEIQCWQTWYCKSPLLGDILCSGENHQVASCANSMNNLNPIHECHQ